MLGVWRDNWHLVLLFTFFEKLENNGFIIICWFLLYNSVNQPYVSIYPFPCEPASHPILFT